MGEGGWSSLTLSFGCFWLVSLFVGLCARSLFSTLFFSIHPHTGPSCSFLSPCLRAAWVLLVDAITTEGVSWQERLALSRQEPPRQDIHIHIAPKDATERANLIESLWTPIDDTPSKSHPIHPRFKSPTWQHRDYLTALLTRPCKGIHSSTLIILFSFFFFFFSPLLLLIQSLSSQHLSLPVLTPCLALTASPVTHCAAYA